ncbi:hypothetical protein [Sulfobacillus thermosulfidooxidans]|uniref:hypothetical protein n=1 Tax=Sulfobacillus thermosulfidooxidans TaxID=28034 RepID=UPI0019D7042E|nr:hypothetical protein [Sulfobacillus thermosulfidooxidans]
MAHKHGIGGEKNMDHRQSIRPWVIATSLSLLCGTLVQMFMPVSTHCVSTWNRRTCQQESLLTSSPLAAIGLFMGAVIIGAVLMKWGTSRWVLLTYGILMLFFIIISFGLGWPLAISGLLALIAAGS